VTSHWDGVYDRSAVTELSWFQAEPTVSLDLIGAAGIDTGDPVIDVGGGASTLVDRLLDHGYREVTVLDIAEHALAATRTRLGPRADAVDFVTADVLDWDPPRTYRLWHDRAVLHFLTDSADRDRYRTALSRTLDPTARLVIGAFAADGPTHCSGLPVGRYDPSALAAEFPGYDVARTVREEHITPAGRIQPFTWLLLIRRRH
jgi:Methyltransferase domain